MTGKDGNSCRLVTDLASQLGKDLASQLGKDGDPCRLPGCHRPPCQDLQEASSDGQIFFALVKILVGKYVSCQKACCQFFTKLSQVALDWILRSFLWSQIETA